MLDELERLEQAATPGPWVADEKNSYRQRIIAMPSDMEFIIGHTAYTYFVDGVERRETNAAFIAAARNALPALLRVARAADNGEWHSSEDCRIEGRAAGCELCQALAALDKEAS